VHVTDKINFEVTGQASQTNTNPNITVGKAVAVTGMPGVWYFPIVLADTLKVAASERFDLKMDNSNWKSIPWTTFSNAWSVVAHTSPVAFGGVDMSRPWPGPDPVQNNQQVFVDDPYIAGYYKGVHIFGYTPDGDLPKQPRKVDFSFEKPLPSPATAVRQDSFMVHFQGRAWGWPDNPLVQVQRDSVPFVSATQILSRTDSVRFADVFPDPQGTTVHEWAFWADRNTPLCACRWQRYSVTVDTMKVPPRPLHLEWDPATPLDVWTTQRKPLTLKLLDASGTVLDTTAAASVAASATGVKFWSAATGGVPVAGVVFSHGIAQIWVSDSVADTATVFAAAAIPGSTVLSASTTVRFSAPPPWPSVDSAWTRDADCDGVPDSISIALSGPLSAGVDLKSLELFVQGKILAVPVSSVLSSGRILSVAALAGLAGDATGTGRLVVHVSTGGRNLDTGSTFSVVDRVGPVLLGISAQERFGTGLDTVRASFSEPVVSAGGWPFGVLRAGAPVPAPGATTVVNEQPALLLWSAAGASFASGDVATWANPALVSDTAGNVAQSCRAPGAIAIRRKSVPFDAAVVSDLDGDGKADVVRLKFRRAVVDAELPDSVKVEWGLTDSVLILPKMSLVRSADSTILTAALAFPWGATSWPSIRANAMVMQGGVADGRRDALLAADSVGPVLLTATLRRGPTADTLRIRVSENVTSASGAQLQTSNLAGWTALQKIQQADSTVWLLVADVGTFQDGDSVRLASAALAGSFLDKSGNTAAPNAPWIHVQAGDPAPVVAIVQDLDGDGRAETVKLAWSRKPRREHGFVFSGLDTASGVVVRRASPLDGVWNAADDTLVVTLGDPFPFGMTSGFRTGIQSETFPDGSVDSLAFPLLDGVAPVATAATVRYAAIGQILDTLVVRLSEATAFAGSTFFKVVDASGAERDVVGVGVRQSPDGRTVWIELDPANPLSTNFRQGDLVRVMPGIAGGRDVAANLALATGHLATVRFGMRPPRFDLDFLPGTWVEAKPVATVSAPIELLVRPFGSLQWTRLDGTPVASDFVGIGPHVRTNSAIGGVLSVFDHQGTFVAGLDFGALDRAARAGSIVTDPAGQYEFWAAWTGQSTNGGKAVSGVYAMRLILRRDALPGTSLFGKDWLNKVYKIGWVVR
ncbi:MAG: hypothetical protein RL173_3016, partial [Fibrobacterota bacterium]